MTAMRAQLAALFGSRGNRDAAVIVYAPAPRWRFRLQAGANGHSPGSLPLWVVPDSTLQSLEIVVLNGRHLIVLYGAVVPEHCSGQTPANMPSEHSVAQHVYAEENSHSVVPGFKIRPCWARYISGVLARMNPRHSGRLSQS